ncbi:reverse transcriptase domain-containing protein [Tanacetum coccineum]
MPTKATTKFKWQKWMRKKRHFTQIKGRRNLEAYVDDMAIKSKDEKMLLADIAETFDNLKRINMKLNPKKCSFGVEEGKFLGYMVTSEGIRANPKKTKAIADLQSPRNVGKEIAQAWRIKLFPRQIRLEIPTILQHYKEHNQRKQT